MKWIEHILIHFLALMFASANAVTGRRLKKGMGAGMTYHVER